MVSQWVEQALRPPGVVSGATRAVWRLPQADILTVMSLTKGSRGAQLCSCTGRRQHAAVQFWTSVTHSRQAQRVLALTGSWMQRQMPLRNVPCSTSGRSQPVTCLLCSDSACEGSF